jgi:hypothetical protein
LPICLPHTAVALIQEAQACFAQSPQTQIPAG